MKHSVLLVFALVAILCFTACESIRPIAYEKDLRSSNSQKFGLYVDFTPMTKAKSGVSVKTRYRITVADIYGKLVFSTQLWLVARKPYCEAKMEGERIQVRILDSGDPSKRWLMELEPGAGGVFNVAKIGGTFFASPASDAGEVPETDVAR